MPFAMLCGRGDPSLVKACDGPTVKEEDAALLGGQVLDQQPHEERDRVPAARDQPTVDRVGGRGGVDMHRLRIVLPGEGDDIVLADGDGANRDDLAWMEVLEITDRWPHVR